MTALRTAAVVLLAAASLAAAPAHLVLADRMVRDVRPANNSYANGPFTVTWAGVNGKTLTYNKSDCTTFVTALLKTAYGFTANQFQGWFGRSSPAVSLYYDAALANSGLRGFKQITDLAPGDLLISKFASTAGGAAGHMMIADGYPQLARTTATQRVFDLVVVDCTGAPHTNDTRAKPQSGVGRGTMRVYTDLTGTLQAWSWGASAASKPYDAAARPIIFAKVPPARR